MNHGYVVCVRTLQKRRTGGIALERHLVSRCCNARQDLLLPQNILSAMCHNSILSHDLISYWMALLFQT